jgi:flagellar hook-basal body complex protein FliE
MKDFIQTAAAGRLDDTRNQFHDLRYTGLARAFWRWRWKAASLTGSSGAQPTPFSDLLTDAVGQVDQLEAQAHTAVAGLMTGSGVDVHQAMIATQKASMSFELALAVRNKAVQAYQQVIGMQF